MAEGKEISPAVKAWLDNVLVPAIVKRWMTERQTEQAPALTDTPDESDSSGDTTGDDVGR
jgi:hypothetical protein